jgi:hypothetical protein
VLDGLAIVREAIDQYWHCEYVQWKHTSRLEAIRLVTNLRYELWPDRQEYSSSLRVCSGTSTTASDLRSEVMDLYVSFDPLETLRGN